MWGKLEADPLTVFRARLKDRLWFLSSLWWYWQPVQLRSIILLASFALVCCICGLLFCVPFRFAVPRSRSLSVAQAVTSQTRWQHTSCHQFPFLRFNFSVFYSSYDRVLPTSINFFPSLFRPRKSATARIWLLDTAPSTYHCTAPENAKLPAHFHSILHSPGEDEEQPLRNMSTMMAPCWIPPSGGWWLPLLGPCRNSLAI